MITPGEYYLHTNGTLHHKVGYDVDSSSDFVKRVWDDQVIGATPLSFLKFLYEAYKLGAKKSEIERLIDHNHLDEYLPKGFRTVFGEDYA